MIEKLYEFNVFFGLQGEAEYYQPLMKRVTEIASSGKQVIITGHSLGAGLARIVGSHMMLLVPTLSTNDS